MKKQTECLAYLEALEGHQGKSAAFASHLAVCPSCREALETMRSMKELKTVYASTGAEALKSRIREEISRPAAGSSPTSVASPKAPTGISGLSVSGAVVALAVVATVVVGSLFSSSGTPPAGISVESGAQPAISSAAILTDQSARLVSEPASISFLSSEAVSLPSPDQE